MKPIRIFFLVTVLSLSATDGFAEKITPAEVIEEFHGVLLGVMKKAKSLSTKERYIELEPAIVSAFDLGFMIRVATGRAWRKASADHQRQLSEAFRRMSIAIYAFRFKGYSGQRFETLKSVDGPRQTILVHTQIVSPPKKGQTRPQITKLTYVTKKINEVWKIVDVLLDGGISEIAVRYSEYRAILKTSGPGVLAERLNKKADLLIVE